MGLNPWLAHVKKFRSSAAGKKMSLKQVLKAAAKTYKKVGTAATTKKKRAKKKKT